MTRDQVEAAVYKAAAAAFGLGMKFGRKKEGREHEQLAIAQQYAVTMVMGCVDMALEEATEEGAISARRARAVQPC